MARAATNPARAWKPPKSATHNHNQEYGAQERPRKTACVVCTKRKLRCDGNKPICGACARLDNICVYGEVEMKTPPFNSRSSKTSTGGTPQQPKIIGAHSSETPKLTTTSSVNLHLQARSLAMLGLRRCISTLVWQRCNGFGALSCILQPY
jgi:hypothetical protein